METLKPNRMEQALGESPFFQRVAAIAAGSGMLAVLTGMVVRLSPVYVFGLVAGVAGSATGFPSMSLLNGCAATTGPSC